MLQARIAAGGAAAAERSAGMDVATTSEIDRLLRAGWQCYRRADWRAAVEAGRAALAVDPGAPEAPRLLAASFVASGRVDAALAQQRRAAGLDPAGAIDRANVGALLARLGRLDEAVRHYDAAVRLDPRHSGTRANRGAVLRRLDRHAAALADLGAALAVDPQSIEAHNTSGASLAAMGRIDEAVRAFDRALALDPRSAEALANRGGGLAEHDRLSAAFGALARAMALEPQLADAFNNLGRVRQAQNRNAEAIVAFDRALALHPDRADVHLNRSLSLLLLGRFAGGWRAYEWRWQTFPGPRRELQRPRWDGAASLAGRTLLVTTEQGLGDTLQFGRYAQILGARGGRVVLEVQPPLKRLAAGIAGAARVATAGEALPEFDLHCPLLSLPLALGTAADNIPAPVPYVAVEPARLAAWRRRIGGDRPNIGLAWSGSAANRSDRRRSIPLKLFSPLFELPNCRFHVLQPEIRPADLAAMAESANLHGHGESLREFADVAAFIAALDLVIAADTSFAHLAGALGRPTWLLLPFWPDWRWRLSRRSTPWYPTLCLYRQESAGAWEPVVDRVKLDLMRFGRGM